MKYDDLIKENKIKQEKRHKAIYESISAITETELKKLLSEAKLFVVKLKELCK